MKVRSSFQFSLDIVFSFHVEQNLLWNFGLIFAEVAAIDKVPHMWSLHVMLHNYPRFGAKTTESTFLLFKLEVGIALPTILQVLL
jgi:hypothetical protein